MTAGKFNLFRRGFRFGARHRFPFARLSIARARRYAYSLAKEAASQSKAGAAGVNFLTGRMLPGLKSGAGSSPKELQTSFRVLSYLAWLRNLLRSPGARKTLNRPTINCTEAKGFSRIPFWEHPLWIFAAAEKGTRVPLLPCGNCQVTGFLTLRPGYESGVAPLVWVSAVGRRGQLAVERD
jgi:hypothetical protein